MPRALLIAFVCHLLLSGYCLVRTPACEAPGEAERVAAASRAALGHGAGDLYTAVLGITLRACGQPDVAPVLRPAPDGRSGLRWIHGVDEPAGSPAQRALLGLRAWSLLAGLASLACTYALARAAFRSTPAVADLTVLLLACLPQWAFSHGTVWAGAAFALATHATVALAVRATARGRFAALDGPGLALGAAAAFTLSPHAWFLVPVVGLSLLLVRRSAPVATAAWAALGFAGGWLLAPDRAGRAPHLGDRSVTDLLVSFVGEFGLATLPMPWVPLLLTPLVVAAGALGYALRRREPEAAAAQAVLYVACSVGTLALGRAAVDAGMLGRELLPAAGPMLAVTAAGLVEVARRWRRGARPWPLPALALLPALPCAAVIATIYATALDRTAAPPATPAFAILQTGLRQEPDVALQAQGPAAVIDAPPSFAWTGAARGDVPTVAIWSDDGTVWATSWDDRAAAPPGSPWTLADAAFATLPRHTPLGWRVVTIGADGRLRGSRAGRFSISARR